MEREEVVGYVIQVMDIPSFTMLSQSSLRDILFGALRDSTSNPASPSPKRSSPTQNRYLPLAYGAWIVACMYSRTYSRATH